MKFKKLVEAKEDVKDQKDVLKKMNLDTAKEDEDKMVEEHNKNVDSFKKAMDECGKIVEGYHYTENKGNYVVNIKNRSSLAVLLENLKKQGIKNRISRSQVEGYRYDVSFKYNLKEGVTFGITNKNADELFKDKDVVNWKKGYTIERSKGEEGEDVYELYHNGIYVYSADDIESIFKYIDEDKYESLKEDGEEKTDSKKKKIPYGLLAWRLNEIIACMNNEEAYYESGWLYIWPDGETKRECMEDFGDKESYKELEEAFINIYSDEEYHADGLYNATPDVLAYAHKWDKKLGLPEIENIVHESCKGKGCKKEELLQEDPTQDRIEEIRQISKQRQLNDDEVKELAALSKKKNESCKRVSKRPIKESPQFDDSDLAQRYWEEEIWDELDNFLLDYKGPINLSKSEKNRLCSNVAEKIIFEEDDLWDTIHETIQDVIYDTFQSYENDLDSGDFDESLKECGKGKKVDASEWAYTDTIEEAKGTKKPRARFNANPQASADFIAKGTSFNQNLAGQPCCESDEEDDEEDKKKFEDEEGDIEIDGDIEVTDAPVEDEFNDGDITDLDYIDIDGFDDVDLDAISVDDIVDEDETALDILKDKIDMHGELSDDGKSEVITIAEKGKLDDEKAPKLTIEANEEETEILAQEFATDEEEESTEDTDIKDEVDDDINFDEIADGDKVDVKKELDNLKDVKVVGKEDTKEDTPVEDEVVEVEDDVDDTTLLDSLVS